MVDIELEGEKIRIDKIEWFCWLIVENLQKKVRNKSIIQEGRKSKKIKK